MTTIFDPKKHLTTSDERRLHQAAELRGMTPSDLIEAAVKREIFSPQLSEVQPSTNKEEPTSSES